MFELDPDKGGVSNEGSSDQSVTFVNFSKCIQLFKLVGLFNNLVDINC